jgi:nicotinamide mononucleotide (NMN) deamidase PncC
VWLACATRSGVVTREVRIRGERERIQRRAAAAALQLVWDVLHGRVAANNAAH